MQRLDLKVRLMLGDEIAMGPGKADLLEAIEREGSISAAARALGMSYRRAWLLVETMNRCFSQPLVQALAGGRQGGGAQLSDEGSQVLQRYRQLQARLRAVAEQDWPELAALLR
jgi:molybdate transport system regulatory protein